MWCTSMAAGGSWQSCKQFPPADGPICQRGRCWLLCSIHIWNCSDFGPCGLIFVCYLEVGVRLVPERLPCNYRHPVSIHPSYTRSDEPPWFHATKPRILVVGWKWLFLFLWACHPFPYFSYALSWDLIGISRTNAHKWSLNAAAIYNSRIKNDGCFSYCDKHFTGCCKHRLTQMLAL